MSDSITCKLWCDYRVVLCTISAQTNCPLYEILRCGLVNFPPKGECCSFEYN